jgi:hypothetical protein
MVGHCSRNAPSSLPRLRALVAVGSEDFRFLARVRRRSRFENPAPEPKRRQKPKRPLSIVYSAHRYKFFGNALSAKKTAHVQARLKSSPLSAAKRGEVVLTVRGRSLGSVETYFANHSPTPFRALTRNPNFSFASANESTPFRAVTPANGSSVISRLPSRSR